jgi:predicted amidophosphoribosyltransferase
VVVYPVGGFDNAFGVLVHALKYDGYRELAKPLGRVLADRIAPTTFSSVVAVPTSPKKRRKRGYGHAEEIANSCADALGVPFIPDALKFTRPVADQTKLSAKERQANLRGALVVCDGLSLNDASVLVVDDVMTTGATMGEAGRALKAAGAMSVTGAIIALNLSNQGGGR